MDTLDLAALRTFVSAVDLGGFGRAARFLHRTPGAVSLQMKTLEDRLGAKLFVRHGKTMTVSPRGEMLLTYARRMLSANDEAVLAFRSVSSGGVVRLGLPDDLADSALSDILASFARSSPTSAIEVKVARSCVLEKFVLAGELDLAIVFDVPDSRDAAQIAHLAMGWWGNWNVHPHCAEAVPLLVINSPCFFRESAIRALDSAGMKWRIALSSDSLSAIWAAASAGMGVTARSLIYRAPGVMQQETGGGLPKIDDVGIFLQTNNSVQSPAVAQLESILRKAIESKLINMNQCKTLS